MPVNELLNLNELPMLEEEYMYEYNQDDDEYHHQLMNEAAIHDNMNEVNNDDINPAHIQQHDIYEYNHEDEKDIEDPTELQIRGNNQELLDDIFGIDDDNDDNVIEHELDVAEPPIKYKSLPEYNFDNPRRSGRNHKLGKWNARTVGVTSLKGKIPNVREDKFKISYNINMTISQGIDKLGYHAIQSIVKEMAQMTDMKVFTGVNIKDLTKNQISKIITSNMFLKEKYNADGTFDKVKSRLVAGGHLQSREIYDNGSSPTVSTSSVFLVAAIAASRNNAVACIDFPGAFLNSDMPEVGNHVVLMRLNKLLTSILIKIDPLYIKYVQTNGTCVVRLKKALYGCVESAAM